MRAAKSFLCCWVVLATAGLSYAQYDAPPFANSSSLDAFLESVDVDAAALPATSRQRGGAVLACTILRALDRKRVVRPVDGSSYEEEATENWSATAHGTPACIYSPASAEGVSHALVLARLLRVPFAVRSGGHSPNPLFANIGSRGILISTSGITDLEYDPVTQNQRSGFGNRWQNVYSYLAQQGRMVVGGRTGTVGLGLTLGGGISHLSNAYGWPSQNIVSFQVVLASGRIVTASESSYSDLFFAIKAGSSNFGIVTHITQRTYPLGGIWGGTIAFPSNASEQFMTALAQFQREGQLDTNAAILPYLVPTNDTILATFAYLSPVEERPAAFAPFYELPVVADNTQNLDSLYELATQPTPDSVPRWLFNVQTMYLDEEAYVGLVDVVYDVIPQVQALQGGTLLLMPQPISLSMVQESLARGPDPMNVTAAPQLWVSCQIGFVNEADEPTVNAVLGDLTGRVRAFAEEKGLFDPFVLLNDAHFTQDPFTSYGPGRYANLRTVARKYDPTGVFQTLVPGGFKLF